MKEVERRSYRMVARQSGVDDTRARIVAALLDLWLRVPYDLVTLDAIAAEAGTTRQTVIRQFGSKDELAMAAALSVSDRMQELDLGSSADLADALDKLVARYEQFGDANAKLGDLEGRFEFADEGLRLGRTGHRRWVEDIFADSLPAAPAGDRRRLIDALYAATDVMVWKLLRRDFGRSRNATRATIGVLVDGVLKGQGVSSNPTFDED